MPDLQPEGCDQNTVQNTPRIGLKQVPWLFLGYLAGIAAGPPITWGWAAIGALLTLAASPLVNRRLVPV